MIKVSTAALAAFDETGPHLQTLAESAHTRVLLMGLRAGQKLKDHTTASQVHIQVLSGSCRVVESSPESGMEAGRETLAGAMDLVIVPSGSRHRVEASSECLLLVSLMPHPAASRYPEEHRDRIVSRVPHQAV